MFDTLKTVIKHCATEKDGETFCPARIIGYGTAFSTVSTFVFNSIWAIVHGAVWDPQAFGLGAGAVSLAVVAAATGAAIKAKTEPQS
jgi:hypothetical protein